jgi:hypothetical protein
VFAHGDAAGTVNVRRALTDRLLDMQLEQAGNHATIDRYIGYMEPHATSHEALDRVTAVPQEVRDLALTLVEAVRPKRDGLRPNPGDRLGDPRPK